MYFVCKKNDVRTPLSENEESILTEIERHDSEEISAFAKKLSGLKNDFWIQCSCNNKALLIICNLHGKIYIRCKSRAAHNINCIFIQKNIVLHLKNFSYTSSSRVKFFALYKEASDISNSSLSNEVGRERGNSYSALGQILITVLNDAGVNVIRGNSYASMYEQLTSVTNSFQDKEKLVAKNIILAKCYRYLLSEQTLIGAEEFLLKARSWFPDGLTPFIIFTSLVTNITANSFTTKRDGETYKVLNKISTTSPWINLNKSAPYFLAASAVLNSDNKIVLRDGFAMPVFSTTSLIPLESNYERTILKILFSICRKYNNITIEKPLLDLFTKDKKKYRPDFILTLNNKKIFIEVLGSANTDYLTHKHYISQIAKPECYYYISVKAYELQIYHDGFVSYLKATLERIRK